MANKNRIRLSKRNIVFHLINNIFLLLCLLMVAVPLINVISQSLSSPSAVLNGKVILLPVEFSAKSYGYVFRNHSIMTGYGNSILYTAVGTVIAVTMTILGAYPLTRKKLHGQKFFLFLFTFTMLFGGGMIPTYLVVKNLGMIDKMWALIIPNAISVYNMIIARTFFMNTIPNELYEAAEIDGANDFTVFFRIVIPLSGSILAVLTLFYAVGLWNMYFDALIYINSAEKYPLQIVLRNIMTSARVQSQMVQATGVVQSTQMLALTESLKYTTIVCASVPVLVLYPFIQKHFTKGVMIGTLKG